MYDNSYLKYFPSSQQIFECLDTFEHGWMRQNKQLKEDVFRSNDFVGKIMEKVNDFGNEHELVETNLKVLQNIVKKKQNQKVKFKDKQATVDLFTANAIMKVYDAVKPDNKKKIEKLMNGTITDFLKLQKFAMKQVKFA